MPMKRLNPIPALAPSEQGSYAPAMECTLPSWVAFVGMIAMILVAGGSALGVFSWLSGSRNLITTPKVILSSVHSSHFTPNSDKFYCLYSIAATPAIEERVSVARTAPLFVHHQRLTL